MKGNKGVARKGNEEGRRAKEKKRQNVSVDVEGERVF